MKTLAEQWGSEVKFTQHLASDLESLNRINDLVGLPRVVKATNEMSIPGGSIDVVGFTVKGCAIVYEHQDKGGRADQTHVSKTMTYPHQLILKGHTVLGSILLCETVDQHYLDQFRAERKEYLRRKYNGHKNLHIIRSQWLDNGQYQPSLFEDSDAILRREDNELDHYKEFVAVYAADWMTQREEKNGNAVTLWHRISELPSRYMAYVHTLKNGVKIGLHCLKDVTADDEQLMQAICPEGWAYRKAQDRATIELVLDKDSSYLDWANHSETLKRAVRNYFWQNQG
jgi:hypothetical protein